LLRVGDGNGKKLSGKVGSESNFDPICRLAKFARNFSAYQKQIIMNCLLFIRQKLKEIFEHANSEIMNYLKLLKKS
jgi:hypothetical protein